MTHDDARLLAALADMWQRVDPPRPDLADEMVAVVVTADLDEEVELLVLVHDSAQGPQTAVRGVSTSRALHFRTIQGWTLQVELDGDRLSGELLDVDGDGDVAEVEVGVETSGGTTQWVRPDEVGFFTVRVELVGAVRFTVRHDGLSTTSGWVPL